MNTSAKIASFHEDVFYAFFEPYRHLESNDNVWGGLGLETFGGDLELVSRLEMAHVWTVIDGDDGSQWVVPGMHLVNRVCYLVTKKPHNWVAAEFRLSARGSSLTEVGLLRQIKRLRSILESSRAA